MKNMKRFLALAVTVAMVSCGNNNKQEEENETYTIGDGNAQEQVDYDENAPAGSSSNTSSDAVASNDSDVVEIKISGNDQMQFDKEELRVKAGQTVRLTLEHTGQLPVTAMGHNVVILDQGTDVASFAQEAAQAGSNDYIPQGRQNEVIANTEMIGGGQTTTIEFEAPEAGTYTFICSFPGHYIQMQGRFIVE